MEQRSNPPSKRLGGLCTTVAELHHQGDQLRVQIFWPRGILLATAVPAVLYFGFMSALAGMMLMMVMGNSGTPGEERAAAGLVVTIAVTLFLWMSFLYIYSICSWEVMEVAPGHCTLQQYITMLGCYHHKTREVTVRAPSWSVQLTPAEGRMCDRIPAYAEVADGVYFGRSLPAPYHAQLVEAINEHLGDVRGEAVDPKMFSSTMVERPYRTQVRTFAATSGSLQIEVPRTGGHEYVKDALPRILLVAGQFLLPGMLLILGLIFVLANVIDFGAVVVYPFLFVFTLPALGPLLLAMSHAAERMWVIDISPVDIYIRRQFVLGSQALHGWLRLVGICLPFTAYILLSLPFLPIVFAVMWWRKRRAQAAGDVNVAAIWKRPFQLFYRFYRSPTDEYYPLAAGPEEASNGSDLPPTASLAWGSSVPLIEDKQRMLVVHGVELKDLPVCSDEQAWLLSEIRQHVKQDLAADGTILSEIRLNSPTHAFRVPSAPDSGAFTLV